MWPWTKYDVTSSCLGYVRASTDLPLMASGICTNPKMVMTGQCKLRDQKMMNFCAQTKDADLWMGSKPTCRCAYMQEVSRSIYGFRLTLLTRGKSLKLMIWRGMLVRTELYLYSSRSSVMLWNGYHADNAKVVSVLPSMTTAYCLVSIKQGCMHSCQLSSGPYATYKLLWTCLRSGFSPGESSSKSSL